MLKPTLLTWILSIAGIILYLPAVYIQVLALVRPHDQKTKNLLVGKNEDYHDKTYFLFCQGTAWADLGIQISFVLIGCVTVLFGYLWAYMIWFAGAFITIYIHLVLIFVEGKHITKKMGFLAFFTYAWGLWFYWSIIVVIYSFVRMASIG